MPRQTSLPPALFVFLLVTAACGAPAPEPEPEPPPQRVENAALGIAIAAVPAPFQLVENSGEILRFGAPGEAGDGLLEFSVGPIDSFGINLVEAVKAKRADFEGAEGGEYYGNRELGTPIGTAFTARGAYDTDTGRVEESWIFAIHPGENRILRLRYEYPDGEGQDRVGALMEILGEVEALDGPESS